MIKCDHCGFGFYKTCPTEGCPYMPKPDYDGKDDFAKSIGVGFEAIRERVAAGGPAWTPKTRTEG